MEQAQQEKVYMERLPLVAMQIRSALGNIYYGMQKLAPADERDEDPILDANAAMLYHGYFRLLRLAKNLESASMLNRKELLPTENTDLKVWLDEIIREAEVPFELKGVQLEMVCEERYAITAVNEPWLSQALWQLLSNALKACSAGGKVTVTLAVQKPHVLIKVKDTGCGHSCRPAGNAVSLAYAAHDPGLCRRRRGAGTAPGTSDRAAARRAAAAEQPGGPGHHCHHRAADGTGFGDAGREHRGLYRRLPAGTAGAGGRAARRGIPGKASGRIKTRCRAEGRRGTAGTRPCLLWRSSPDSFPHFPESMRRR